MSALIHACADDNSARLGGALDRRAVMVYPVDGPWGVSMYSKEDQTGYGPDWAPVVIAICAEGGSASLAVPVPDPTRERVGLDADRAS
jgi:hypothetical protein